MINNAQLMIIYLRINRFRIPILLPFFVLFETLNDLAILLSLIGTFSNKTRGYIQLVDGIVDLLIECSRYKNLEFVNINVVDSKDKIKIIIRTK